MRGYRAESDRHYPKGLRWRLRRDELQAYPGRYQLRLSNRRDLQILTEQDIHGTIRSHDSDLGGWISEVDILFRKDLKIAEDPEGKRKELQADYREKFANPYRAAELGYVDEIIEPSITRSRLIRSFELLANKRQSNPPKKHSNIPL